MFASKTQSITERQFGLTEIVEYLNTFVCRSYQVRFCAKPEKDLTRFCIRSNFINLQQKKREAIRLRIFSEGLIKRTVIIKGKSENLLINIVVLQITKYKGGINTNKK